MSSRIPVHCELIDVCLGLRQRVIAEALQRYAILLQEALSILPFPKIRLSSSTCALCASWMTKLPPFFCITCENCCAKIGPQSASLSTRV